MGRITRGSHITYFSLMFFIVHAFKRLVHVFAGQVKIVSHSSCRTSTILKYFCPLLDLFFANWLDLNLNVFFFCISQVLLFQQLFLQCQYHQDPNVIQLCYLFYNFSTISVPGSAVRHITDCAIGPGARKPVFGVCQ